MKGHEQDPESIDELRALYGRLRPAALPDDAAEADPETARSVQWMRTAWSRLEVPPLPAPVLRALPARRPRLRRRWLALAAALAALLGGGVLVRMLSRPDAAPAQLIAHMPGENVGAGARDSDVEAEGVEADDVRNESVEVVDVRTDQVELRSGPVRLLLLAPSPTELTDEPTED